MRIERHEQARDEALVRAFAADGDTDALEVLLRRHEGRVYGLAYRLLGNRPDALDATQEVFILLFRKARSFRGDAAFTTWLYRLTTNVCHDALRRRARAPQPSARLEAEAGVTFDEAAEHLEVTDALARIPIDQRTVLVLRELQGLSYEEIAEAVGIPIGTVKSRIARGRFALAGELGEPAARPERLSREDQ